MDCGGLFGGDYLQEACDSAFEVVEEGDPQGLEVEFAAFVACFDD